MTRTLKRLSGITLGCVLLFGLSGCGTSNNKSASSSGSSAASGTQMNVAMVADVGGLNDKSFNTAAYKGLKKAEKRLGVHTRVYSSASSIDYTPNLAAAARHGHDLVIAVGYNMIPALRKVSKRFPKQKFALLDADVGSVPEQRTDPKPKNIVGLIFKESEVGYLVGYLAGSYVKKNNLKPVIGGVGAAKIPPVELAMAGYFNGARAAHPKIKPLINFSLDFVDQPKCKELALSQIDHGAQVVFQFAGRCGLGALDAAKHKHVQGIGCDSDQGYLGDHILSSALKRADTAIYRVVASVKNRTYQGGKDLVFNASNNGIGLGKLSKSAEEFKPQLAKVKADIASGKIQPVKPVGA